MIFLFVYVLALVLLVCCWAVGDVEFRTKLIWTLIYLGSWGLIFVSGTLVASAQALLCIILGFMTFGPEFFSGRRR
jgi:hypothetical protein